MDAAAYLLDVIGRLEASAQQRLAGRARSRFDAERSPAGLVAADARERSGDGDARALRQRLAARYRDAVELLNACRRDELEALARALGVMPDGAAAGASAEAAPSSVAALRLALWRAAHGQVQGERAPAHAPVIIGSRLVVCAPPRGLSPALSEWPRPLPPPRPAEPPDEEPECLDTLLDAADRALGVRLGGRGRDGKGAWGQRAAQLLGIIDRGDQEPDWRGDVEIKTVAVARSAGPVGAARSAAAAAYAGSGPWRVVEDPAISTVGGAPITKLQRVLWLCRADAEPGDATLISWYLLDWDDTVAALVERYLHTRPKGPRGSAGRGFYLHKRFFADAGLLASLNGPPLL
jgi:hypothetical protein